jgi:hypothetical protein
MLKHKRTYLIALKVKLTGSDALTSLNLLRLLATTASNLGQVLNEGLLKKARVAVNTLPIAINVR